MLPTAQLRPDSQNSPHPTLARVACSKLTVNNANNAMDQQALDGASQIVSTAASGTVCLLASATTRLEAWKGYIRANSAILLLSTLMSVAWVAWWPFDLLRHSMAARCAAKPSQFVHGALLRVQRLMSACQNNRDVFRWGGRGGA